MDRPLKLKNPSTQIHGGTYDPATGRLVAELNGATFSVHNVHPDLIDGMEKADSHGKFFHQYILGSQKQPLHEFTRVR